MARLFVAGDHTVPNPLSAYLREALPDEFAVVADPVLHRCPLDAVVVGPGGLTLISEDGNPSQAPSPAGARPVRRAAPSREQTSTAAVQSFVNDEFPKLRLPVHYLAALRDPTAELRSWNVADLFGTRPESLAEAVMRVQAADGDVLSTPEAREALATAVRDRRFTVNQRATRPFVFRGGGLLRVGTRAWTIRAAVEHMDRYPADGVYHLCNGTLARWLQEQGAADLAGLAKWAVHEGRSDRRRALEIFLLGTGLVARPRLAARPKELDLGYVLSGETATGRLRLKRGRGRGYLFGNLETSAAWLRAEPGSFAGGPVAVTVSAETLALQISPDPYEEALLVASNASEEPIPLPVRLRVVAEPAPASRWVQRPLAGLLLGALLGGLIGWLWAQVAPALPVRITAHLPFGEALDWTLTVMAFWAIIGLVRGLIQPPAWPVRYAAGRWLAQLAGWASLLALLGAAAAWWTQQAFGPFASPPRYVYVQAALVGVALSTLPASIFSLRRAKAPAPAAPQQWVAAPGGAVGASSDPTSESRRNVRRALWGAVAVVALILALVLTPKLVRTNWTEVRAQGNVVTAESWAATQWDRLNGAADDLMNRFYLRYYDRRAPEQPKPASTPAPVPTAASPR
jgi:hypothetical protein